MRDTAGQPVTTKVTYIGPTGNEFGQDIEFKSAEVEGADVLVGQWRKEFVKWDEVIAEIRHQILQAAGHAHLAPPDFVFTSTDYQENGSDCGPWVVENLRKRIVDGVPPEPTSTTGVDLRRRHQGILDAGAGTRARGSRTRTVRSRASLALTTASFSEKHTSGLTRYSPG